MLITFDSFVLVLGQQSYHHNTAAANLTAKAHSIFLNMEDTTKTLNLVSKTGDKFELSYEAGEVAGYLRLRVLSASRSSRFTSQFCLLLKAKLSQLVFDASENKEDDDDSDVPIIKVESECLKKVVEFLKHYEQEPLNEIKTPLEDNTFEGVVKQEWYRNFVLEVDNPMLFDLVTAANFMAIREFYPVHENA